MKQPLTDFSIFKKLRLRKPPLGVKYLFRKPQGIEQMEGQMSLCEMIKEGHRRNAPFYIDKDNEDCFGKAALGMMVDQKPFGQSGEVGYRWGIFQEPRANSLLYSHNYHLGSGTVKYVAFSPLDKLTFEPDLVIVMCKTPQAEIILRSVTYSTGEIYESKTGPVLGCSWLYVYPYLSGKVNYMITGLGHGMKGREVFPDGWVLISIPFNWIPAVVHNMNEMKWVLPAFKMGREGYIKERQNILDELAREFKQP